MVGKYVVIDGMDGSGKGTQLALLKQKFPDAVFTREPGGTPLSENIRSLVVDDPNTQNASALTKLLLFCAARVDLQQNLIMPALRADKLVIADRGPPSTWAYQVDAEEDGDLSNCFDAIHREIFGTVFRSKYGRRPDLYIILDLHPEVARERVTRDANRTATYFDKKELDFYRRVRHGFLKFAQWAAQRDSQVIFIDAHGTPERVHELIMHALCSIQVVCE